MKNFNCNDYKIVFVNAEALEEIFLKKFKLKQNIESYDGTEFLGLADFSKNIVYISNELRGNAITETMFHEFVHHLINKYECGNQIIDIEFICDFIPKHIDEIKKIEIFVNNYVKTMKK